MPNDGFFNEEESSDLIKFWEDIGRPSVPPGYEHVSVEDAADQAIDLLRYNLTAFDTILLQTKALYATIKFAEKHTPPVRPADCVTAAVMSAAANDDMRTLFCELTPAIQDLRERVFADDLTVLKMAKITGELLKLQPKLEQLMRWHADVKRAISQGIAQLN